MEYWINGTIWSGIQGTLTAEGMDYWQDGYIYGDMFSATSTSTFTPIIMWIL